MKYRLRRQTVLNYRAPKRHKNSFYDSYCTPTSPSMTLHFSSLLSLAPVASLFYYTACVTARLKGNSPPLQCPMLPEAERFRVRKERSGNLGKKRSSPAPEDVFLRLKREYRKREMIKRSKVCGDALSAWDVTEELPGVPPRQARCSALSVVQRSDEWALDALL